MEEIKTKPLLKWAGGKRQLLPTLIKRMPERYDTYFEPFLGGGALLFALQPKSAYVNDLNSELINMYLVVKNKPQELFIELEKHEKNHGHDYFYEIRNLDRTDEFSIKTDVELAARTIYLNHTCFNGLYRVNRKGYFNTPLGRYKKPNILDKENITSVHKYFNGNNVNLYNDDYKKILKKVKQNDFVYLDPPYDPISKTESFTGYTSVGFSRDDQIKLKEECDRLNRIGAFFMVSNSNTKFIKELYKDYKIIVIPAKRCINSKGNKRKNSTEVIIINYQLSYEKDKF